jgi:hypothetical protein
MTHITIERAKLEQWILKVIRTTKHVNNEAFVEVMVMRDDMNEVLKQALAAQPAVPDVIHHTDLSEHPQYIEGWNDCRAEMLKGMK